MDQDQFAKSKKSRGNLPREAVDYFMAWLYENRFRAYPCEETKKQMARDTGLTLQQVNNWYINARRRVLPSLISKEGKEPRDYRITRKRVNTAPVILPNQPAYTNSSTDSIAPLTHSRSHCSDFTSFTTTDSKNNTPISSLLSTITYACPCVTPVSPTPHTARPPTLSHIGQHVYANTEYLLDLPSINHSISSVNKSVTDTETLRLTMSSRSVLSNDCIAQPQPEPSLDVQNTSPYDCYNLMSNNDCELGEILPHVENLVHTTYGITDENFRILEFNMI